MTHSGNVLAFVGDAVLSLQVREYLVSLGYSKTKQLQETSTQFVSAGAQAKFVNFLILKDILNTEEKQIFKRGRNAKSASMAKNAQVKDYRMATGLEALWGYLYLSDQKERLSALWEMFKHEVTIK